MRPETVESLFVLYRITGDPKYVLLLINSLLYSRGMKKMTDLWERTAGTVHGAGRFSKHSRGTRRLIPVDIHHWTMLLQFLPGEGTKWRHSFWGRLSSICTCFLETIPRFRWINMCSILKPIRYQLKPTFRSDTRFAFDVKGMFLILF